MIGKTNLVTSKDFNIGLFTKSDIVNSDPNLSPNCMDIQWFFDGTIGKRMGSSTSNSVVLTSGGMASGFIIGNALTNGLQSYWKLDEVSGTRFDVFGSNDLSDNNATGSITGIRNNAALFVSTESNSLIAFNSPTLETGNIPFTIAGWFYLNSTSSTVESTIVSKRDPSLDSPTVLLLHCDGVDGSTSFPDSSLSNHTVTANGNTQVDTAQFKFGTGSALFDGTGDNLTLADSSDWDIGTGAYTIDFWARFNVTTPECYFLSRNGADLGIYFDAAGDVLQLFHMGSLIISRSWNPVIDTWYHIAITRDSSNNVRMFIDGVQQGVAVSNSTNITGTTGITIGSRSTDALYFSGWIDEFRIVKGRAAWTSNFTPPSLPYATQAYEYWVYVNTNGLLTFSVSSSNLAATTSMTCNSIGTLALNTWYNFIAWNQTAGGSTAAHIGLSVNLSQNTATYTSGVKIGSAPFVLGAISDGMAAPATKYSDARIDEVGFWKNMLTNDDRANLYAGGSGNTYTGSTNANSWYSFDFGASGARWYTVCAGTGILASSNLGATFVNIATTRTASFQYLDRSKNVLIATSDAYDRTLYWAGSAGTFAIGLTVNSAPNAKYSINYQGFLILLNSMDSNGVINNRRFTYADENLQLTDAYDDSFDLPSSADDEITGPFILNKFLYVSTKYRIFRINYTGGNPDWQYIQVKNFGYVPRTVKVFTLKQGQVAVGLDWSRRLRAFDGYDDQIISDNVENSNDYCDFAMQNISLAGSGLLVSNAEFDPNQQEYRLNVAIGAQSTQTTHAIVLNARTLAMYPYQNQPFNTMCVAESAGKQFLMAVDRSGFVHILNSGNLDVSTPINEVYDSPIMFNKTPSEVTKNKQINFYFGHDSCGTIYYQERFDFSRVFSEIKPLRNYAGDKELLGTESTLLISRVLDLPSVQNTYQFRLTSSSGTANPWKLPYFDYLNTPLGYGRGK